MVKRGKTTKKGVNDIPQIIRKLEAGANFPHVGWICEKATSELQTSRNKI